MKKTQSIALAIVLAIAGLAYAGAQQQAGKDKKCTDCCCKHDKGENKMEGSCCKKH